MPNTWQLSVLAALACCVGAVPSFLWSSHLDVMPRLAGIALFVGAYLIVPHMPGFASAWSRVRIRRALKIGYGIRVGASVLFPVGMVVDLVPGMISTAITGLEPSATQPWRVLATTIVQGAMLHIVLAGLIGGVYLVLTLAGVRDEEPGGRAFEVIPLKV